MSNIKPILSICLCTFNRKKHIKRWYWYLKEELENIDEGAVEVIISNNASQDGTKDFLDSIAGRDSWLRVNNNEENIGAENLLWIARQANGKYLWQPGDDDYAKKGLVKKILDLEQTYDIDYLYLTCRAINETSKKIDEVAKIFPVAYDRCMKLPYHTVVSLPKDHMSQLMFQTSAVHKTERVKCLQKEMREGIGNDGYFVCFTTIHALRAMLEGTSYFLSEVCVLAGDEITWSENRIRFGAEVIPGIIENGFIHLGIEEKDCKKIKAAHMGGILGNCLLSRDFFREYRKRGCPNFTFRAIPWVVFFGVRRILKLIGLSRYYKKESVDPGDFGLV